MSKVVVQLLVWNGEPYIPYLMDSLKKQTRRDWTLAIADNGSEDGTVETMERALDGSGVDVSFFQNEKNIGFAAGHNRLFQAGESEYVLILNQDMYLQPDCIETLAAFLDAHPDIAATAPRLMKWNFAYMTANKDEVNGDMEGIFTDIVDSLGLRVFRNRRVVDAYEGSLWLRLCETFRDDHARVFGVSGACAMIRRSALQSVAFPNGDIYDASYFLYKEDVDLAYRLQSAGYHAAVLPGTVAYHDRTGGRRTAISDDATAAENKKKQGVWVRYFSYKNHLATLWKNEYWQNTLIDFLSILWYEGRKLAYNFLYDRDVLGGLAELWRERKRIAQRRACTMQKRKIGWKEMRKWWR